MLTVMLLCVGGFVWMAAEYTRWHPLDLTNRIPQVEKYLLPKGLGLSAEKAELFFDDGPVIRVSGLGVTGSDGSLGVFVEQAAIKLAGSQLFLLSVAPKMVEAHGVTLRLVRDAQGISVAGLNLPKSESNDGIVDWLNGLSWNRVWGRMRSVKVADLNLLVRDDVQKAEWVLEQGNMSVYRYDNDGESGTLTAVVRRLYGDAEHLKKLNNVPVLVSFAHAPKADSLGIRGRIDRANADMVTDYFPPQFKDLLKAQGQVEIGTRLLKANVLEQPWLTLRLTDVKVQPPKFSKQLELPELNVTASYVPPAEGVSNTDVLLIKELQAVTKRGNRVTVSGSIVGLQNDPLIDLTMFSPEGELQGVFDLFPDEARGFSKALAWLRPNIEKGKYQNLSARYAGKPSAFPGCGDACGVLEIDARVTDSVVQFLNDISPAKVAEGTFKWRGQTMSVKTGEGRIGNQIARDVTVEMDDIFAETPTLLRVVGRMSGEAGELMAELNKIGETGGKVPQGISGKHESRLSILVPLPRGRPSTFASSTVLVSSSITDVGVKDLPQLKGLAFAATKADVDFMADKTLRVESAGLLGGNPMKVNVSMNLQPKQPKMMKIAADGSVAGGWLMQQAPAGVVSVTGVVGVNLALNEDAKGKWNFDVKADGNRAHVAVDMANVNKPVGKPLSLSAKGSYVPSGTIVLDSLDVAGDKLAVKGSVRWNPADVDSSIVKLPGVRVGETDVSVDFANNKALVTGRKLDLSGYDLFKGDEDKQQSTQPENLSVSLKIDEVLMENGKLDKLDANVKAIKGRWNVQNLKAFVDGKHKVSVISTPLRGQGQRKRLNIDIADLGRTLEVMGVYDKLAHGRMTGEITYDTPEVGGGLIRIDDFELKNPPTLVQLLSLLSLEQLLSGSSSTMFEKAVVPVRVDNGVWHLDNASFEGPSMSLRLDGSYKQTTKELGFDGKMAPGIPLNRLVSRIPVLGTILAGSQDGVVVADFRLKGTAEKPDINVRPLSVITPGLLKDFWRGVTGSDKKKPQPEVIDGRKP
ncbi:MAG: hypothetical protein EON60_00480 [Alphaproteobacteria bacterium]|nr:MAG: hypothetical protein EON60_00480 [Alphaproteobacteria bacterium]